MSVALKAAAWASKKGSKKQKTTSQYIGHRGVLPHKVLRSLDSPVHRTPGSHFKMLITQPRRKKNQTALGHL